MNFVADEGLDRPIVERLRRDGHLVSYIAEMEAGTSDEAVLQFATSQNALKRYPIGFLNDRFHISCSSEDVL